MQKRKWIYMYRVKEGAAKQMLSLLQSGEGAGPIKDGAICCIVDMVTTNSTYFKSKNDHIKHTHLAQIRFLHRTDDWEAFILYELLERIPDDQWIIIEK